MTNQMPLVSVITVVFNGKLFIENTIQSVLNQTYPHVEYIVIDGGSTDGTPDIIKQYSHRIHYWSSEPDKGVYDAMNKGIEQATGKWINFMNAGDYFYTSDTLEQVFVPDRNIDSYAIVYGDAEFRLKNIAYIVPAGEECTTDNFMPFSHQAAFVRADVAKATKFDLQYKITADTAFSLGLLQAKYEFKHLPITICSYNALEGLSVKNEIQRSRELVTMQVQLNGADIDSPYYRKYMRNAYIKQLIRYLIPNILWTSIRENKIKKEYKETRNMLPRDERIK